MDAPLSDDQLTAIEQALYSNRKIAAIKLYRQSTGSGLVEAKNAIEKLESELRAISPEKFSVERPRSGCLGVMVMFIVMGGLVFWFVVR